MKKPVNILVVITREKPIQPALSRALLFAKSHAVNITLFSAIYEPALEISALLAPDERQSIKNQYVKSRHSYLDELASTCDISSAQGSQVHFETKAVWHKKAAQAVVEFASGQYFDLTIKRISSDASASNPLMMPVDWHLLRFCPTALLLVREPEWRHTGPILGAVSATCDSSEHQKLNHQIIDYTQYLAELLSTEAHVINSHVSPNFDAPVDFPMLDLGELRNKVTRMHAEKMQALMNEHPFGEQHIHVVEGIAEEKIPETADKIDAQVVVMGTVGRTGLTATFMGNTAERVLSQLRCEVLALKPEHFEI